MSETDPAVDETAPVEGADEPASRNPLALVAAVVGAVVLAALVWFFLVTPLLLGDDSAGTTDPTVTETPTETPSEAQDGEVGATDQPPAAAEAEAVEELPIVTFEVFLSRDPFEPVIPEPVETVIDTDGTATSPPVPPGVNSDDETQPAEGDGQDPVEGTPPATGAPPPTGPPSATDPDGDGAEERRGCRNGEEPVCDGRVLSLLDVETSDGQRVAAIQVDTTVYEVREGDRFASNFVVRSIEPDRATVTYGDEIVVLRTGDRVLK